MKYLDTEKFFYIIRNYKLGNVLKYITNYPQYTDRFSDTYFKSQVNPYHNFNHTMNKVVVTEELCFFEGVYSRDNLIADLFHDIGHSGGNKSDDLNIQKSIEHLKFYKTMFPSDDLQPDYSEIENLIRVTQFPFVKEPQTIQEKIMRDSDLLASFLAPNWFYVNIFGLFNEFRIKNTTLTIEEHIDNQIIFMNTVKFFTKSGQEMFDNVKIDLLDIINEYKEMIS